MQIGYDSAFNWADFSLARINLIAAGRGNCGDILPKSNPETVQQFRASLAGRLSEDDKAMLAIYDRLRLCADGTLGAGMWRYYNTQSHTPLTSDGSFPVRYIMIHDAHHVMVSAPTTDQGELNVLAFECGMINGGRSAESIIPIIAQARAFPDVEGIAEIARHWEVGCHALPGLLEDFDLGTWVDCPLQELLDEFCIAL